MFKRNMKQPVSVADLPHVEIPSFLHGGPAPGPITKEDYDWFPNGLSAVPQLDTLEQMVTYALETKEPMPEPTMPERHSLIVGDLVTGFEAREAQLVADIAEKTAELADLRKTAQAYRIAHKMLIK